MMGWEMDPKPYKFAEVNGARLRYDMQGQGKPVVLIHSALGDMESWDAQIADFSARYQVIRYDVRGWGASTGPESGYNEYEDLRALLDFLGIPKAALVGCSYGGGICIDFALACPERAAALVLVGPALGGHEHQPDEATEALNQQLHEAYDRGDKSLAAELTARVWVDGPGRSTDQVDPSFRQRALQMITATYALPDRPEVPWLEPHAAGRLAELCTPTLVLLGEYDIPNMHQVTRLIAESAPNARRVILKDTAHLPNMEHPDEFNHAVLDFLSSGF
jgi:pimeloyl-ACP methyl ester carboxylesterase